jgi:hypothetical protein
VRRAAGEGARVGEERVGRAVLVARAEEVERLHVACAFPDGEHLRVAEEPLRHPLACVAVPAEELARFARRAHGEARRLGLRKRRERAQQPVRVRVARGGRVEPARRVEHEEERAAHVHGERGDGARVERLFRERLAERLAPRAVLLAFAEGAARDGDARDGIVESREVHHLRHGLEALAFAGDELRVRVPQLDLGRCHAADAELVLEADAAEARVWRAVVEVRRNDEEAEPARAGRGVGHARERERDVRVRVGGEPLVAREAPRAVARGARGGRGGADVAAARPLREEHGAFVGALRLELHEARHVLRRELRRRAAVEHEGRAVRHAGGAVVAALRLAVEVAERERGEPRAAFAPA